MNPHWRAILATLGMYPGMQRAASLYLTVISVIPMTGDVTEWLRDVRASGVLTDHEFGDVRRLLVAANVADKYDAYRL